MLCISDFYTHQRCPSISGIYFPDGRIRLISVKEHYDDSLGLRSYQISLGNETNIFDLSKIEDLSMCDCAVISRFASSSLDLLFQVGEGDWGTDGFISATRLSSNQLSWLFFSDTLNPFSEVRSFGPIIKAYSTSRLWIEIDVEDPEKSFINGVEVKLP